MAFKLYESTGSGMAGIENRRLYTILNRLVRAQLRGLVAGMAALVSPDGAAAAGAAPTKAEYDVLVAIVNEAKALINGVVADLIVSADVALAVGANPTMAEFNTLIAFVAELSEVIRGLGGVLTEDGSAAVSADPVKADHDAEVLLVNEIKLVLNAMIAAGVAVSASDVILAGRASVELTENFI